MIEYKLENGSITKDGHAMFLEDVVKELNRKASLEVMLKRTRKPAKTTKVCKNCGVKMANARPKKKFCSNKGVGNCKDAYHNETNPRGYQDKDSWEEHVDGLHPHSSEALGQS